MGKVIIRFNDGNEISAEINGDSYIVNTKPEFPEDLSNVVISGEDINKRYDNAELIECASVDGRYWFAFREIPQEEADAVQLRADVDYLLLITE